MQLAAEDPHGYDMWQQPWIGVQSTNYLQPQVYQSGPCGLKRKKMIQSKFSKWYKSGNTITSTSWDMSQAECGTPIPG
jgi:hypothetical protein